MRSLRGAVRFESCLYAGAVALVVLLVVLLIAVITREVNRTSEATANELFRYEAARVEAEFARMLSSPLKSVALLVAQPGADVAVADDGMRHPALPILSALLRENPDLYSGYVGHADGSFLQMIATHGNPEIIKAQQAPDGTATIVRAIVAATGGGRVEHWTFLDDHGAVLGRTDEPSPQYDPRERSWYREAMAREGGDVGQPYVFNSTAAPGVTASQRLPDGTGVVGFDVTLDRLQEVVQKQHLSPHSGLLLVTGDGRLLASNRIPWLGVDAAPPLADVKGDRRLAGALLQLTDGAPTASRAVSAGDLPYASGGPVDWPLIVARSPLLAGSKGEMSLVFAAPLDDFNGSLDTLRLRVLFVGGLLLLLLLPAIHVAARSTSQTLRQLAEDAARIDDLDASDTPAERATFREFAILSDAFERMKRTVKERTRNLTNAIESVDQAIALWNGEDRLVVFNQRFSDYFGPTARSGMKHADCVHAAIDAGRILAAPGQSAADLVTDHIVHQHRADGVPMTCRLHDGREIRITVRPARNGGVLTTAVVAGYHA